MSALHRIKIEEIRNLELIDEIVQIVVKHRRTGIMPNDATMEEKTIAIYLQNRYSIYKKHDHIDDHFGI